MSRPLNTTDKAHRHLTSQGPSERTVFLAGVLAAVIVGVVIVFFHAG